MLKINSEKITEAAAVFAKTGFVWVASADDKGIPHISVAKNMSVVSENTINLTEWFCPVTVYNLDRNPAVSIVVWDKDTDTGHQLTGEVKRINEVGMQDGFTVEAGIPETPQVEREIFVEVVSIFEFKNAPHLDRPE